MVLKKIPFETPENDWPALIPKCNVKNFPFIWRLGSSFIVPTVALCGKLWLDLLNSTTIHNHQVYLECLDKNYKTAKNPLITICNHSSCLDDPLVLSSLMPWSWNFNSARHRFAGAAHNICFTNQLHSLFFSLGKSIPIHRGAGIYQPSVNYLLELIRSNHFLHVFPQGKVIEENYENELNEIKQNKDFNYKQLDLRDKQDQHLNYGFKWGLARLLLDSLYSKPEMIIDLLPFYHLGMTEVLPNTKPYIPQLNKRVTIFIRENGPLKITNDLIRDLCSGLSSQSDKRIAIMNYLEDEMKRIKYEALKRHFSIDN